MKNKRIFILLIFILSCFFGLAVNAAPDKSKPPSFVFDLRTGKFFVSGNAVAVDPGLGAPFVDSAGNVMIPLRYLAEGLGLPIEWDAASKTIGLYGPDIDATLKIGSDKAIVNGEIVEMLSASGEPVTPYLIEGRVYLPLRALFQNIYNFPNDHIEFKGNIITVW